MWIKVLRVQKYTKSFWKIRQYFLLNYLRKNTKSREKS